MRIVLITLDTLRLDSLLEVEGKPPAMELLRRRAEHAALFERYYAATSTTQPSHASILTGLHPWEHGVTRNGVALMDPRPTIAERLRAKGFRTAAVVASFPLEERFGFARGFDEYTDEFTEGHVKSFARVDRTDGGRTFQSPADFVAERCHSILDASHGGDELLWFHFVDPHPPYGDSTDDIPNLRPHIVLQGLADGEAETQRRLVLAREGYDADVRYLDGVLDGLLERLERESTQIETHILVVSDHGESFGEDGSLGHDKRLTPEQIHVPLLIFSNQVEAGRRSEPVGSVDLTATMFAMAGMEDAPGSGRDLRPPVVEGAVYGMRRTYTIPYEEKRLDGSLHVIEGLAFYTVAGDGLVIGNSQGLVDGAVDDAGLRQIFAEFESQFAQLDTTALTDDETIDNLRALGYVIGGE